jgi:hypothetical protein
MCDQDDFDFDEVEEEKGVCDKEQTINDESATSLKDYFREYHKRPEVIENARLRQSQLKQQKTMLHATIDEVSYAASLF